MSEVDPDSGGEPAKSLLEGSAAGDLAAALMGVIDELDWSALGACYCDGDASEFFGAAERDAIVDTGLLIADDLAQALALSARGARGPSRSLYVGAALAELAPILCEKLVLAREVVWINLPGAETTEIARALDVVARRLGVELPRIETRALESVEPASVDHVWLVSVLTDPDAFPALHDHLYERTGELATGRGDLAQDTARASALLDVALRALRPPCLVTTTDEELALVQPALERLGWKLEIPDSARLTAIVGDPLRHCTVTLRA